MKRDHGYDESLLSDRTDRSPSRPRCSCVGGTTSPYNDGICKECHGEFVKPNVTPCELGGSTVRVAGKTTQHYEPVGSPPKAADESELKTIVEHFRLQADSARKVFGNHINVEIYSRWADTVQRLALKNTADVSKPNVAELKANQALENIERTQALNRKIKEMGIDCKPASPTVSSKTKDPKLFCNCSWPLQVGTPDCQKCNKPVWHEPASAKVKCPKCNDTGKIAYQGDGAMLMEGCDCEPASAEGEGET